jgi:hypothetical protein
MVIVQLSEFSFARCHPSASRQDDSRVVVGGQVEAWILIWSESWAIRQ